MSLQKFMIVNAVPFCLARYQSSASKTIINVSGGIDNNNLPVLSRLKKTSKTIAHSRSLRMIKKRNKLFHHNSSSSHVSLEKLKLQRGLLEQQLLDVKAEKMRLFLENEDLKLRCSSLEEESNFLRMQTSQNCHLDERNQLCEDTLKHAEGLGSSTDVHSPDDNSGRIATQFSTKSINNIPTNGHLPHIQRMDEICDTSTCTNDTDVFVVPLSQDIINQPSSTDLNAVARMICHEEEISCEDMNDCIFVEEMEADPVDDIIFPEPWTFDNLYEDPDDEVHFYV